MDNALRFAASVLALRLQESIGGDVGGKGQNFRDTIRWLEDRGWEVDLDRKGYPLARCPCGRHLKTIHRTPSNPEYWKNLRKHVERTCPGGRP